MSETSGKVWCEHCHWKFNSAMGFSAWFNTSGMMITDEFLFCPRCGAKRPEEKKDDAEIFFQNIKHYFHNGFDWDEFKKQAVRWKEKDHIVDANKTMVEEEKPKRLLANLLRQAYNEARTFDEAYESCAKAALNYFEGILPNAGVFHNTYFSDGYNQALAEIRQRIERERQ